MKDTKTRIDKWLWAVRIFKTRSQASEACKKGRIFINNIPAKASKEIEVGDVIGIRRPPAVFEYEVLAISSKRMGAKLTVDFVRDITPKEQLDLLEATKNRVFEYRERGTGRPTKQERRMIDKLKGLS